MNKWLVVLLIFSVTINLAVVASLFYLKRQQPVTSDWMTEGPHKQRSRARHFFGADSIISTEQWQKIRELRRQYFYELERLRRETDDLRAKLRDEIFRASAPTDSIDMLVQRITTLQADMERLTIRHLYDIRPLVPIKAWENMVRVRDRRTRQPFLERRRALPRDRIH